MQSPNPFGAPRCLLHNDKVFADTAASIAHTYPHLIPDNQVNNVEVGSVQPWSDASAEVEFVCPK